MPKYSITVNGKDVEVDVPAEMPLLWVLRDELRITGPKYGCGVGVCRACTCLMDDEEIQPCMVKAADADGAEVTTIEGLAEDGELHPVQQAWVDRDVPQCGFCQPGQIMTAVALIEEKGDDVSDADIDRIENVCRCGTYGRIREAIKRAAQA
ncbi:(2Fe-2S)-binding protein [Saccharopolyspora flava]|uniref:Isoquinoline 1-oxidoreductase, alpha subunit n=1 Tax=Saccharopolyspora flava TaxID=95161 RepID=A0A1I6V2B2_9PSEU|nr:(2Fe-2S)-binding protein [Saccharopolyspora flava]SFT07805.1 isoquinoline 1-oxidoreductase, alpha subunit [Saccharopolyspora flava]